jgi:transcriptional regulator with XRE-family HTH domain
MNKLNTYSSNLIDELLQGISPEELERTKKRMLLAARIDEAISEKGWKKKDFAKALDKTPSEISKWLSGTHNFTLDTLFDIERVLNINLVQVQNKESEIVKTYVYHVSANINNDYNKSILEYLIVDKSSKSSYRTQVNSNTAYTN